jgi:hypothetical protein
MGGVYPLTGTRTREIGIVAVMTAKLRRIALQDRAFARQKSDSE